MKDPKPIALFTFPLGFALLGGDEFCDVSGALVRDAVNGNPLSPVSRQPRHVRNGEEIRVKSWVACAKTGRLSD